MDVVGRTEVDKAIRKHRDAADWLSQWWRVATAQCWRTIHEVRETYATCDPFGCCLIFNCRGNKYRLIVRVRWATATRGGTLQFAAFMPHAEYDKGHWKRECGR